MHRNWLLSFTTTLALVTGLAVAANAGPGHFQGFETDNSGWDVFGGLEATRVPSGTDGVTSATGSFHGVTLVGGSATNLGGYTCCFPDGGYTVSLDVYLDFEAADGTDQRMSITNAINGTDCLHLRDFVFSVGYKPGSPGEYVLSASNNCPGWPSDPGRSPVTLTQGTGWYTFKWIYSEVAGFLSTDMEIRDSGNALLGSWNLTGADATGTYSGNRYLWFCQPGGITEVPIDNTRITATIPCEPVPVESITWGQVKQRFE